MLQTFDKSVLLFHPSTGQRSRVCTMLPGRHAHVIPCEGYKPPVNRARKTRRYKQAPIFTAPKKMCLLNPPQPHSHLHYLARGCQFWHPRHTHTEPHRSRKQTQSVSRTRWSGHGKKKQPFNTHQTLPPISDAVVQFRTEVRT